MTRDTGIRPYTPAIREEAYLLCAKRDGHKCKNCKRVPAKQVKNPELEVPYLTVDHIDGNENNNPADSLNWQLLCQSCNNKKRKMPAKRDTKPDKFARYKQYRALHERVSMSEVTGAISREMDKNDRAEMEFRRFTEEAVASLSEVKESVLLDAGAMNHLRKFKENISQATLARYLAKWCNPINGDYERFKIDERQHIRRSRDE